MGTNGQNGNGTALAGARALFDFERPNTEPSLRRWLTWLQSHEDRGAQRCAEVRLCYQTAEAAAEDRSPALMDQWTVDPELDEPGRRDRYRVIAEKAWELANEYMASDHVKIAHVWRLYRMNGEGQQVGQIWGTLRPALGSNLVEFGADPGNEKGGYAASIRAFNSGTQIQNAQSIAYARLMHELLAEERVTRREAITNWMDSVREREELLDRQAERQVRIALGQVEVAKLTQDVEMRGELYKGINHAVKALVAKYTPMDQRIRGLLETLDENQFQQMVSLLRPDQQMAMMGLVQGFAAQQKHEEEVAARAKERAEKEAAAKAEADAKAAAKSKTKRKAGKP